MSRPTCLYIDKNALLHNISVIKKYANNKPIVAMVKANAYGCGIEEVVPTIKSHVYAFGVACLEEAIQLRKFSQDSECILIQGVFSELELIKAFNLNLQIVIHNEQQLKWLVANSSLHLVKVWVKVNTGMNRLGFAVEDVPGVIEALKNCAWVNQDIVIMSHFACADEAFNINNAGQLNKFNELVKNYPNMLKSMANSAAIISMPDAHFDIVRAGIMLYGVSPIQDKIGADFNLKPVMIFKSKITTIHNYKPYAKIGYGATWQSDKESRIGVVPVGYGDGYPRVISANTKVFVNGYEAAIVGRVSMDMLTIDITNCYNVKLLDDVELWGCDIPIESVALATNTIGYELLCQVSNRVKR